MSNDVIRTAARAAHEANRVWCAFSGDHSQVSWDDAPEWQRRSAMTGVQLLASDPDLGDDATHNSWLAEKVAEGWVYGPVKDVVAKTHPCVVPFSALPPHQQFKDTLFRTVVLSILKGMNYVHD